MKVVQNNYSQYENLLSVLCGELNEKDPDFQRWLAQDIENKKLYHFLKGKEKGRAKDDPFDKKLPFNKDQAFENVKDILGLNIQTKKPFYRSAVFMYAASLVFIIIISIAGHYSYKGYLNRQADTFAESGNGEVFNTIYVPKGILHEISLSDGSKVLLNSDSKLVFPTHFSGKSRRVELEGEAYFEVQKSAVPFIVKTAAMQITVTGTSFNVNAYQDNTAFQTTLVEGSVKINIPDKPDTYTLNPGNNFSLSKYADEISIQKVNTEKYTSWMRGELIFRNQPLDEIFTTLKRWYDFDIEYTKPAIRTMRFTGSVEKKRPLVYFLNQIRSVTEIKYRHDGERIILY